jgi:hypothetical protein
MKGDANVMQMYNERFMEALSRLKNLGEAQETIDEYRNGLLIRDRS